MSPTHESSERMPGGSEEPAGVWTGARRIRLLLVDDDDLFREILATNLADQELDVVECASGKACLEILAAETNFDIILLDWRMPEMSGIEVLQKIKAADIDLPVVFLTAFATERNEETALDCGAVDFLDKSRSGAVLARRIRILVSNSQNAVPDVATGPEVLRVGWLEVFFRTNRVYWREQLVPLTITEFRVAQLLVSHAGEDVSYRAIYDVVHGRGFVAGDGTYGYRTNVRSLIRRIRQKFREIDPEFAEIENYPSFGYRWREHEASGAVNGRSSEVLVDTLTPVSLAHSGDAAPQGANPDDADR